MIRPLFWLILTFFIATAIAYPKPLHELATMTTETGTIWKRQAEDCTDINNCRTIYKVIWGALATTFACVWTAMHPNVPSRQETRVRRITRRVELVVLGLLAPELVAARAFAEWSDARRIANDYKFSKTHAHFLQMGGFIDEYDCTITEDDLLQDAGILRQIQSVNELDLKDRSKNDALSKSVTILQTSWFTLQCIVRSCYGLALTEIELSALSLASISFLTYIFWWRKPLGITRPIVLQYKSQVDRRSSFSSEATGTSGESCRTTPLVAFLERIPVMGMLIEAMFMEHHTRPFLKRLWCGHPKKHERLEGRKGALSTTILIGLLFGGIHLTNWNGYFLTYIEKILWRAGALLVMFLPVLIFLDPHDSNKDKTMFGILAYYGRKLFARAVVPCYTIARNTLLILAIISLRDLPPSALQSVSWVALIPHL